MSLEESLQNLTTEIVKLQNILSSQATGGKISSNPDMDELTRHSEAKKAQVAAASTDKPAEDDTTEIMGTGKPDPVVATRQQYVFFKETKTGQIIAKGEEVPTHGDPVGVKKAKFEELAAKYDFDPATGAKNETKAAEADDDDLDLDTDTESGPTREEVKAKLVEYMKLMKGDREVGLKVLQKFGSTGTSDLKPADFQACFDLTEKLIAKQKSTDVDDI